jgi:hypothetical protein
LLKKATGGKAGGKGLQSIRIQTTKKYQFFGILTLANIGGIVDRDESIITKN